MLGGVVAGLGGGGAGQEGGLNGGRRAGVRRCQQIGGAVDGDDFNAFGDGEFVGVRVLRQIGRRAS